MPTGQASHHMFHLWLLHWVLWESFVQCQHRAPSPIREGSKNFKTSCLSPSQLDAVHRRARELVQGEASRSCGDDDGWTRVASLNMADPSQEGPSNWTLYSSASDDRQPRGCGGNRRSSQGTTATCDSVVYPVQVQYSSVCGKVLAFQKGNSTAFYRSIQSSYSSIESPYVSGVSLTHGSPGSRQHIWTFAAAAYEQDDNYLPEETCPCTNVSVPWPYQVPSFVGEDYFCETGNRGLRLFDAGHVFHKDLLWDGKGCGPSSTCCQYNCPPVMFKFLPYPTSDDLELRLCHEQAASYEDKIITLIEIYVK